MAVAAGKVYQMTLTALASEAPEPAPALPAADRSAAMAVAKARASLSERDARVLRELTLLADRYGHASPSQTVLAKACRMSERSVRTAVKALEVLGWISREAVNLGKTGRAPDRYTVHPAPVVRA